MPPTKPVGIAYGPWYGPVNHRSQAAYEVMARDGEGSLLLRYLGEREAGGDIMKAPCDARGELAWTDGEWVTSVYLYPFVTKGVVT